MGGPRPSSPTRQLLTLHSVPRKRRFILVLLVLALAFVASLASWVQWGQWPNPGQRPVVADADAIVVLGGGDPARWKQGLTIAAAFPDVPLIVTGDGGTIVDAFIANGIQKSRIEHEKAATSTVENAKFTKPMLDRLQAKRVILVTNWFHVPRSFAIFRKYQPGREFTVSFSPKPEPLTKWDLETQRRERMAVLHNLLVHGVWSF